MVLDSDKVKIILVKVGKELKKIKVGRTKGFNKG